MDAFAAEFTRALGRAGPAVKTNRAVVPAEGLLGAVRTRASLV